MTRRTLLVVPEDVVRKQEPGVTATPESGETESQVNKPIFDNRRNIANVLSLRVLTELNLVAIQRLGASWRPVKTLTNEDCSAWLASHKLAADPYYSKETRPPYCEQFPLPQHALGSSAMLRSIVTCAEPFESALLHVTDWALYSPDEAAVVSQLRQTCGERLPLIQTPGHVFTAVELNLLIGLFALVTAYGWSAYLYFDHGLTLLSWEGELLDLWATDSARYNAVCELIQHMGISANATRSA